MTLFLPILALINIEFDGLLPPSQSTTRENRPPRWVSIGVAPMRQSSLSDGQVTMLPEPLCATVNEVNLLDRIVETDAGTVRVLPLAPVTDMRPGASTFTLLHDVEPGDSLLIYGFATSPPVVGDADFEATVVLIVPPQNEA